MKGSLRQKKIRNGTAAHEIKVKAVSLMCFNKVPLFPFLVYVLVWLWEMFIRSEKQLIKSRFLLSHSNFLICIIIFLFSLFFFFLFFFFFFFFSFLLGVAPWAQGLSQKG